jgi:hypothetical protein
MCLLMKRASSLPIAVRHVTCGGFGNMSKHLALSFPCLISSNSSWITSLSSTSTPDVVKHSKVEAYELGVVWKYITGCNLNGAHDSMVDVVAQLDVISHEYCLPYLNVTNSLCLIQDIFTKTERREMLKKMEPERPVHEPWQEQTVEHNIKWEPRMEDSYNGAAVGGVFGPSSALIQIARQGCLASMFFLYSR